MIMTFATSKRLLTSGLVTLALSTAALPALAQQAAPAPSPNSHSIAAVVNSDIITSHDLRQRVLFMLATTGVERTEDNLRRVQAQALRNLIDEHLQMQEAEKYDQSIDDREVNQNVARLIGRNGLEPQEVVERLSAVGVSIETLRDQVRSEIAWQRIVNGLFGSRIRISDTVIEETLARITADANEPSYRLAEIYIEATPEIGGPQGARDGAQAMIDQLGQGAPFPLLAQQFSSAPSAATGGDMGWLKAGDLRPQIAAVLPELDPGEVSEPIIVPGGAYVVALLETRVSEVDTLFRLSQVRVEADTFADAQARLTEIQPTLTSCDALDDAVADLEDVTTASMGELKASELSEEIQVRLQDVQVGEMTDAFEGPTGAAVIMVCKRETTGSEIPTRDAIENRLMDTQLAQASRRHLRDLRRKATISVRG
ncbi:peptidylprolyl isomerase [Algimonas porphyrae]|uniref:Parvulin-like PPIase n=1 Tax=Algimonas porphyrae TaxID=1128113 RepID=A0ABQ5UXN6_9PROT|nr:peptidylprolyl isomerase [Algimonas porphyrae]GLQ19918.1 chaperone SurA [Algimonas porphyrae]